MSRKFQPQIGENLGNGGSGKYIELCYKNTFIDYSHIFCSSGCSLPHGNITTKVTNSNTEPKTITLGTSNLEMLEEMMAHYYCSKESIVRCDREFLEYQK